MLKRQLIPSHIMQNLFSHKNMCRKSVNELPRNNGRKRKDDNDTEQKWSLTSWKY